MTPVTLLLIVLAVMLKPAVAAGQGTMGPGKGRVLLVHQLSWWAADGLPESDIVASDTTLIFRPDSARGWPSTGMVPVRFDMDPGPRLVATLSIRPRTAVTEVLVSAEEAHCRKSWAAPHVSSLIALAMALAEQTDDAEEEERPLPHLVFGACHDTIETDLTRSISYYQYDSLPGQSAFVYLAGTIEAVWRQETHFTPGGIPVRAFLRGSISSRVRITPDRVLDTLNFSETFRGFLAYPNPAGYVDTVYGTWVVKIKGGWQDDPRKKSDRLLAYFTKHGRYPPDEAPDTIPSNPYWQLVRKAETDSTMVDSLFQRLIETDDPEARLRLGEALTAVGTLPHHVIDEWIRAPVRVAPTVLLDHLIYANGDSAYSTDVARMIARELAPLVIQRRRLTDREDLGSTIMQMLASGRGFTKESGPVLAAAALQADDPHSRDLLLFAAYQADPPRYRSLLMTTADTVSGYGPIARAWVEGNGMLTSNSWGVSPGATDSLERFPGIDAPPDLLTRYLSKGLGRGRLMAPLRMRFAAEGRDLRGELAARFNGDTAYATRSVLSHYLERLSDSTARPWLETLLTGPDSMRAVAYELLPHRAVQDTTILSDLQNRLIGYIVRRIAFRDTAGNVVPEPWVHDERPDQRILVSDGLLPAAIEPWNRLFAVMSMDSVNARVANDGLQMAWVVGSISQTGERYYASVTLRPVGGPCLCGGGVNFVLEHRGREWVVVGLSRWIS